MSRKIALAAALLALALSAPIAEANPGPVGEWALNEGSGSVAADSSGFGDNGMISGGARWTTGPGGSALTFDGTGQVRVPDAPQLEPTTAVSVAAWVARVGTPGAYKYIVAKGGHGCVAASYGLYSGPNGGLEFYVSRGYGTTYARSPDAGTMVWDGRWHLAVGTFDGTTIRLYVDGAQVGTGTQYPGPIEYLLSDANDLFIGAYPSCPNKNFDSTISDVRVWNRALSPAEVSALLAPSQQPPTDGGNLPDMPPQPARSTGDAGGSTAGFVTPILPTPMIHFVSLSTSTIRLGRFGVETPLITYSDLTSARVTFTILRVQSKAMRMRCANAARHRHRSPTRYCPLLVSLGRFVHQDHPGRNQVRFSRSLLPGPGSYVVDVTPSLDGKVGRTIVIPFSVVKAHRPR